MAAAKPKNEIAITVKPVEAELGRGVAAKYKRERVVDLNWEAEKRYVMAILTDPDPQKDFLREIAAKNPQSVANAMLDAARLGLSLSPTLKQAYLIPSGGKSPRVSLQPSYLGMEQAVLRSGKVALIQTELVYANDEFKKWTTTEGTQFEHVMARGDRGEFEGAFCLAKFSNGESHVEYMSVDEINACREAGKRRNNGKEGPSWKFFEGEMRKKCVVRRGAKHWPTDKHIENLMAVLDAADPMDFSGKNVIEGDSVEVLGEEDIKELEDVIPKVEQKAIWLMRAAHALQFESIDSVPRERKDDIKAKLIEVHNRVFPPEKVDE